MVSLMFTFHVYTGFFDIYFDNDDQFYQQCQVFLIFLPTEINKLFTII